MKIWLTSDTHFGHERDFLYSPRGFDSVGLHDQEVIRRWNQVVSPDDIVYHLGDVMLNDNNHGMECLRQLNGHIKIIRGNHDTDTRWRLYPTLENVEVIGWAEVIKYKGYNFYLSHHPTITANLDFEKPLKARLINLCGHVHTQDKFLDMESGVIYHVEMDAHDCMPVSLDDILTDIKAYLAQDEKPCEPTENSKKFLEFVDNK